MSVIRFKRQSGEEARPQSLQYGEPAVNRDGRLYVGDSDGEPSLVGGGVVSERVIPGGLVDTYTLYPEELSAEDRERVETSQELFGIYASSRIGTLIANSLGANPYRNRAEILASQDWVCPPGVTRIDVLLAGGGGGSGRHSSQNEGFGGGGGGRFAFAKSVPVTPGQSYEIVIGAGGAKATSSSSSGSQGGTTSAFGFSAEGGYGGYQQYGGNGGSGGGTYEFINTDGTFGQGGSDGGDGGGSRRIESNNSGRGLDETTRNPYTGKLYCGGGGAGESPGGKGGGGNGAVNSTIPSTTGEPNSGGGGGGGFYDGTSTFPGSDGGSGVVVIYY